MGVGDLGTTVTQAGSTYQITGGIRPSNGPNLFHSFGQFSVARPDTAQFLNTTPQLATSNILARVTGGSPSSIFGTIDTLSYPGANLFLMNPSGIIFGPNATLNVGGIATFTSADYLRLADGNLFYSAPNQAADALLSAAPVAAFGFLGSNPGAITVQGSQLSVSTGQGIEFSGGNITVQSGTLPDGTPQAAQLSAPGGHIHLVSVASPGEILAGTLDHAPNINGQSFGTLGTIEFSHKSVIDVSGDGGGTVLIRGGRFIIDDSLISANITGPATGDPIGTSGAGIDIQVTQDAVIQNAAVLETNVAADTSGVGSGGVRIRADRIEILGIPDFDAQPFTGIISNTQGAGNAGNIILRATGNIEIANVVTVTSSSGFNSAGTAGSPTRASGNSGNVELTSTHGNMLITHGGEVIQVTSQTLNSSGNTGIVTASAPEGDIVLDGVSLFTATRGTGGAGQIEITAKNLQLNDSFITDDNFGPFRPGGITVMLSENLTATGNSVIATVSLSPTGAPAADLNITAKDIVITQGSLLTSATFLSGPGGNLRIVADTLQITDGSQVASGSTIAPRRGGLPQEIPSGQGGNITIQALAGPTGSVVIDGMDSGLFTNTQGTGAGGNINLAARSLTVQNGGTISASTSGTEPSATGGSIAIATGQSVTLNRGASITASSTGPGDAGNISITAAGQLVMTDSKVTTEATQADGGNITLKAGKLIHLTNSEVISSVGNTEITTTQGGNITIDPDLVVLRNSRLLANAFAGTGGNIKIVAGLLLVDPSSVIDASSTKGVSGTVTIESAISDLSGSLVPLPQNFLSAGALLASRCAARVAGGSTSSFVVAGRDGLPLEPGGTLPSPLLSATASSSSGIGLSLDLPTLVTSRLTGNLSYDFVTPDKGCS